MQARMIMRMVDGKQPLRTEAIRMTTADNIRLWLVGDEYMRLLTYRAIRQCNGKSAAAHALHSMLHDLGITHSPEGAKITYTSVRKAITWLDGY